VPGVARGAASRRRLRRRGKFEHGILEVRELDEPLSIGARLRLVPGYSDAKLVLHDHLIGYRAGRVTEVIAMPARGRLT
jgi:D-serine deaminase-like pyridoxal phosphate-dependent protein